MKSIIRLDITIIVPDSNRRHKESHQCISPVTKATQIILLIVDVFHFTTSFKANQKSKNMRVSAHFMQRKPHVNKPYWYQAKMSQLPFQFLQSLLAGAYQHYQ